MKVLRSPPVIMPDRRSCRERATANPRRTIRRLGRRSHSHTIARTGGGMRLRPLVRALRRGHRPVRLGSLGTTQPVSWAWGYDRGLPIDRWYIERFLEQNRADITGRVLEVKDTMYTDRF